MLLSNNHWVLESFRQRMTTKEWREILLDNCDHVIFNGVGRTLVAKNLGYDVVEVYKAPLDALQEGDDD